MDRPDAKITVAFKQATVFDDVSHIVVDLGEEFVLNLENFNHHAEWFSNNDQVLEITELTNHSVKIKALTVGKSLIEVVGRHHSLQKAVQIRVRRLKAIELEFKGTVELLP